MEIDASVSPWNSVYKIMIGSILPRPIGWISTIDSEGNANLAPYSFFSAVCANPPTVLFCPSIRAVDRAHKDTLRNVTETGEFVVNIVTRSLAEAMNISSTEYPPEVDEFVAAGLTPAPSAAVRPPRVGESPIHFECRLDRVVEIGREPGGGSIVIGRVVHLHVDEAVLIGVDKINLNRLDPIGRLSGNSYCRVTDAFDLPRPPSQIKDTPAPG